MALHKNEAESFRLWFLGAGSLEYNGFHLPDKSELFLPRKDRLCSILWSRWTGSRFGFL